ncbi:TRAP transporter permease [Dactylosporangium aurantiacum]|uniref:TRAP transporter permease n=1 Tax=Dactylosporangium aurantiacum TaxID=35754 RepID=UPI001FE03625|nr:TRAP transporter fused permease subunit [Dactylosporangium aurantiacum]MDG6102263.1 TRAP transporter fused permease subunit [Dactylosporangium aurantiacum]
MPEPESPRPDVVEPGSAPAAPQTAAPQTAAPGTAAPRTAVADVDATLKDDSVRELAAQFEDEKPGRRLTGAVDTGVTVAAAASAVLVLWQVFRPLAQGGQYYLAIFLACVLPLVFVVYPSGVRLRRTPAADPGRGPTPGDWILAAVALAACAYPLLPFASGGYDAFLNRQGQLDPLDVAMGTALLLLVLEACRRTTGWVLPVVCGVFLAYDYYGGYLPQTWSLAHLGLDFDQIVDALYNSQSGFYGTPLDVAASYIVLFTIYGAVLDASGAGAFFVELSVAAFRRSRSAAGRTAVASGFLLGTVSGSGAATTVSIGAVTWPILRRAGYPADRAGGMLAAAGVGAILSPPTLGAAAFIIAEYLDVSYLSVLGWATVPTLLYYLGILLAVEIDARRFGARPVALRVRSPWTLLGRFGYHFASLLVIIVLLALEQPATRAVIYATLLAALLSFLDRRHRLTPRRLVASLAAGIRGVLPVVAVCVAAGIITASTTKTGLGPQLSGLMVDWAQSLASGHTAVIALTAVFAAVALTLLGLAVPVTASFIIGWVIIGQALLELGVDRPATAMFIFYFAVLSEATPPTALASVAAAAVTGGKVFPTMWQTLRYALPAYLVPIAFVVTPAGRGLLGFGGWDDVGFAFAASAAGVLALSVAAGGWLIGAGPAGPAARVLAGLAALALLWLSLWTVLTGVALLLAAAVLVLVRASRSTPSLEEEPA